MSRRKGERAITTGFQPLPAATARQHEEERRLVTFINREAANIVRTVDHACRTSQAPAEAQQALGTMKQHLRAAAQAAMTAIGFSLQAREGSAAPEEEAST